MDDRRRSRSDLPKGAPAFVDDANRGRRTGKLIPTVQLDEDGFESIEGLFGSQAYSVSAPKQRARKQAALTPVAERSFPGEDGSDMDITQVEDNQADELDDYNIPEAPSAPAPPLRRPIPRRSSPGIDHVPSPRGTQYYSQSSSQSTRRAKAPLNSAIHRSHSAQRSSSPIQPEPDFEPTSSRKSLARRSTMGGNHSVDMDLDDDEGYQTPADLEPEEEVDVGSPPNPRPASPSPAPSPPKSKRKPRAITPPPPPADMDMEDDIAAGLADVDAAPPNSDSEPDEPPPKSNKGKEKETEKNAKGKGKEKAPAKRTRADEEEDEPTKSPTKKARPKSKKENVGAAKSVQPVGGKRRKRDFNAATPPNVRRSQRERFSPLEWWRGEKFVYGRSPDPDEGPLLVPLIRAIERPPKPPPVALSKKTGSKRRVKVKKEEEDEGMGKVVDGDGVFGAPRAPEEGMDDETEELGVVLDYATGREVERRIAFPGARVEFTPTEGPFHFQKIFGDSDFFAAGVMKIPVDGKKPNKPSKENTFVFYCVSGAVQVKVHKSTFVIAPGGMFLAPRGNSYTISNISERDAYIFFAQSRKVLDDSEEPPPLPQPRESIGGSKAKARVVKKKS